MTSQITQMKCWNHLYPVSFSCYHFLFLIFNQVGAVILYTVLWSPLVACNLLCFTYSPLHKGALVPPGTPINHAESVQGALHFSRVSGWLSFSYRFSSIFVSGVICCLSLFFLKTFSVGFLYRLLRCCFHNALITKIRVNWYYELESGGNISSTSILFPNPS